MNFVIVLIVKVVVIEKIPKSKVGIGVQYTFNLYEKVLIYKQMIKADFTSRRINIILVLDFECTIDLW